MIEKKTAPSSTEIERRFLVPEAPPRPERYPHEAIRQGYLALDPNGTEVRIRQKGTQFFQTVKRGSGLQRLEIEFLLTRLQFEALWPLTEGRRIDKTRYAIAFEGHLIELDVYAGTLAGLLIAEVEFASVEAATAFAPPSWLGREVTDDPRYRNQRLAVKGLPR